MKEVRKLLKLVSDGLKSLAQGVESIAEKIDDDVKYKSDAAPQSNQSSASPKPSRGEGKAAEEAKEPAPKAAEKKAAAPAMKEAAAPTKKKAAKPATATATVLNIIGSSNSGIKAAEIKSQTGYEQKKVSNIVYKLKKQGKIKAVKKGVYVKS